MHDNPDERLVQDEVLIEQYGTDTVTAALIYYAYLQRLSSDPSRPQPEAVSPEAVRLARLMWHREQVQKDPVMLEEAENRLNNPHSLAVAELYVKSLVQDIRGIDGIIHDEDWQERFGEAQEEIMGTNRTIEEWKFCGAEIPEQTRQCVREVEDALSWIQPEDESA